MPVETNNTSTQELVNLMDSRANVYKVLSRSYVKEIDAAFAQEFAEAFSFESSNKELTCSLHAAQEALAGVDDSVLEQLAVDFDRVFFGMGPLTARHAFPYESVYTSERGIMMQDAYAQVVHAYREQHLAKDTSFTEPEDHIAVELAFMATLSERAATFLREGLEAAAEETVRQQITFAQNHLLNWIDRFCIDLASAAPKTFYESIAIFTKLFVQEDVALLGEIVS